LLLRWCWTSVNGQLWSVKSPCVRALVWLSNAYFIPNLSVIMMKGAKKLGMFREIDYQFTRFVKDYYYSQKIWFSEECEQPSECACKAKLKTEGETPHEDQCRWEKQPLPPSSSSFSLFLVYQKFKLTQENKF
jgi:hypothetical protein